MFTFPTFITASSPDKIELNPRATDLAHQLNAFVKTGHAYATDFHLSAKVNEQLESSTRAASHTPTSHLPASPREEVPQPPEAPFPPRFQSIPETVVRRVRSLSLGTHSSERMSENHPLHGEEHTAIPIVSVVPEPTLSPMPRVHPEAMDGPSAQASAEARLQEIVDRAVERAIAALARNPPPPGLPGPLGPQGTPAGNNGVNGWKIEDLGYFNPDLSDPADAPVKFLQNHTYYRDVCVFVERLEDLQAIKGDDLVRNNIYASLRGSALDWYTVELTDFERRSLRQLPLVDGWYAMLVNRFKLRTSEALGKLTALSFGPAEVHQGRSVRAFAQAVFRYSQAADIRSQYNQITQAWTKLHPNLRCDIPEPTETTTIADFLSQLEAKESIWRDIAAAANRRGNFPNRGRGREYSFNPNSGLMNSTYQPREFNYSANAYQRPYQIYPQNPNYQNTPNSFQRNSSYPNQSQTYPRPPPAQPAGNRSDPRQRQLEFPKQPKLLADKPAYSPAENKFVQGNRAFTPKQPWNRRPTAYQVSIEDSEEIPASDLSINTANDSVLPYENSPNKEHQQKAEMQELEKSSSNSFELGNEMETDDYVSYLHSHLHECSKRSSVMNSDISRVPIKNSTTRDIILAGKARLGNLTEISALTTYPLHIDESDTVTAPPTTPDPSIKPVSNPLRVETSTHNGVTIYSTGETACRLSAVVDEFDIWGEKPGSAEVPEDRWMVIPFKEGWDEMILKSTVYPQGPKERELIDQIFDRLYQQGRMEWSLHHTPSGYPVFVAYRHVPRTFCRVYVDERHLHAVFSKLKEFNICVNPRKTYVPEEKI